MTQENNFEETKRLAEAAGLEISGKNIIWESVICTEEIEALIKIVRAEQSVKIDAMRTRISAMESALRYAIEEADGWHDESRGGPIEDDDEMDAARKLIENSSSHNHPTKSVYMDGMRFIMPISTEPAIVGRVPTPWLMDHMHELSKDEFYNDQLSEDDLRTILNDRLNNELRAGTL